jgi:5-(carboxyamino)imidazole ribonucleotide mutase
MAAVLSVLPVIGVPVSATKLNGMDALLSIVQMIATGDLELRERLRSYKQGLRDKVMQKSNALRSRLPKTNQ